MRLFIDIETIPSSLVAPEVTPDARLKDPEKIAKDIEEKQIEEWAKEALTMHKSKVVCVSAIIESPYTELGRASFYGSGEKEIFSKLSDWLYNFQDDKMLLIGHNIKSFDLPIIRVRGWKYKLPVISEIFNRDRYDKMTYDTLESWAGTNYMNKTSLSNIADFFGIENHKPQGGSQSIWDWYKAGKMEEIAAHCMQDVLLTREVWRSMRSTAFEYSDNQPLF